MGDTKGSEHWIRETINNDKQKRDLADLIGEGDISWLSPLKKDDSDDSKEYKEYMLNGTKIQGDLKGVIISKEKMNKFWPSSQPKWDAIGIIKDTNTIILLEAKAHTDEGDTRSGARRGKGSKGREKNNTELIEPSFIDTLGQFNKNLLFKDKENEWFYKYYQTANRLVFWHKLNKADCKVVLVFLNFVGDKTYKETSATDWQCYTKSKFNSLLGKAQIEWEKRGEHEIAALNNIPSIKIINFTVT